MESDKTRSDKEYDRLIENLPLIMATIGGFTPVDMNGPVDDIMVEVQLRLEIIRQINHYVDTFRRRL